MKLREYQDRAVSEIRAAFGRHRSVCLALQVGGGKTVIACDVIRRALKRGTRVLFVVHRIELVEQACERLRAFGIEAGIIKAGFHEDRARMVQVACVPSLVRRNFPPAELVIFDETHHVVSASWLSVLNSYRQSGAWILGITATPLRLDGKPLGDAFEAIIEPVTTRELIEGGFLLNPTVYAPPSIDRKGLHVRGGDYALPELAARMQKLTAPITDYWHLYCRGKRTLVFAVNIEHSRQIEDALRARGARIAHIDGTTDRGTRASVNARLRSHELDVVTQCQIWTEGLDIPELEALIIARPTKSLGLHRQMIGRVMRPAPGKSVALVLDHAGNHHEHGQVADPVAWTLLGRVKREAAEPVRTCPACFAIVPPDAVLCPECGAALTNREEVDPPGVDNPGVLVAFDGIHRKATTADKEREYRAMVQTASDRSYKLAWARMRYQQMFGVWPRFRALEEAEYRCAAHEWEAKEYGPRSVTRCARCYRQREPPQSWMAYDNKRGGKSAAQRSPEWRVKREDRYARLLQMRTEQGLTLAEIGKRIGNGAAWAGQLVVEAYNLLGVPDSIVWMGKRYVVSDNPPFREEVVEDVPDPDYASVL